MEITNDLAMELSLAAGDQNAKSAGREVWAEEDVLAAKAVYEKLKPVQKMDEAHTKGEGDADEVKITAE